MVTHTVRSRTHTYTSPPSPYQLIVYQNRIIIFPKVYMVTHTFDEHISNSIQDYISKGNLHGTNYYKPRLQKMLPFGNFKLEVAKWKYFTTPAPSPKNRGKIVEPF